MFNCEKHDKHKELFAIRIYIDDFVEGRDAGNIPWLERKANAVKKTGMSSIEAFYATNEGKFPKLKDDPTVALYGGGYSLYKDEKIICIVGVSGMAHEDDAKLVEEAVKEYLETK